MATTDTLQFNQIRLIAHLLESHTSLLQVINYLINYTKQKDYVNIFLASYLGDQRSSYNQKFGFRFRINDVGPRPGVEDIIIEGGGAKPTRISLSITDQNNPMPGFEVSHLRLKNL